MKINLLFCLLLLSVLPVFSQKYSTYYYQRTSLFEQLPVTSEDIVFAGNSITDGCEWAELFDNSHIKNRGISGDTTGGLYDRLSTCIKGHPRKIFLMIGINDVPHGISADSIATNIHHIVRMIKKESPVTRIYLQGLLPVNPDFKMFEGHTSKWKMISGINQAVRKVAKSESVTFIDLYSHFVNKEGKLSKLYTNDGLHLMGKGYLLWRDIVKTYLYE